MNDVPLTVVVKAENLSRDRSDAIARNEFELRNYIEEGVKQIGAALIEGKTRICFAIQRRGFFPQD